MTLPASCGPSCTNHLLRAEASPTQEHLAEVFFRGCGATTAFNTQVSIVGRGQPVRGPGNVFRAVFDRDSRKYATGSPRVELRWLSPKRLEVDYDGQAHVGFAVRQVAGIGIAYRKRSDW
jgi:hypothetical protein